MSAETLRRASTEIRRDWGDERPFMTAVADWLDGIEWRHTSGTDLEWPHPQDFEHAVTVALAYLGEDEPCGS